MTPAIAFKALLGIDDRDDCLDFASMRISLVLRPPYRLAREEMGIKVRYLAEA